MRHFKHCTPEKKNKVNSRYINTTKSFENLERLERKIAKGRARLQYMKLIMQDMKSRMFTELERKSDKFCLESHCKPTQGFKTQKKIFRAFKN